ncbi:MAG: hypothetical protein Q8P20_01045 [bacterium]|nr:hypothetical protein [bacterium]
MQNQHTKWIVIYKITNYEHNTVLKFDSLFEAVDKIQSLVKEGFCDDIYLASLVEEIHDYRK